jgi:hypothetical protein
MEPKPHHTRRGFRNNHIESVTKSLGELLRWQAERIRRGLPPKPRLATPQAPAVIVSICRHFCDGESCSSI